MHAALVERPLCADDARAAVATAADGALVLFEGVVRNHDGGRDDVVTLGYSAHPDATARLLDVATDIEARHGVRVFVEHRLGELTVGECALLAAVAAPHRAEAFAACAELVDEVKSRVPVWKRQVFADGTSEWVGLGGC